MNFALIGDINGHADALKLALDAIEDEGIITILQTGNPAWGVGGSACIALLRERGVQCVQGQRDRVLAKLERKRSRLERELGDEFPAYAAAHDALKSADIEWLGMLPHEKRFEFDGVPVLLCNGIPDDQQHFFAPGTAETRIHRAREAASADIVASGGAPAYFAAQVGQCLLLNAPAFNEKSAQWLRVDTARSVEVVDVIPSGT